MIIIIIVVLLLAVVGYLVYELFLKPKGQEILTTTISPNIRIFNPITTFRPTITTFRPTTFKPSTTFRPTTFRPTTFQPSTTQTPTQAPTPPLYSFTSHTFTNAGAAGRIGPIFAQIKNTYSSASWAQNNNFLNMANDNGIQLWTVPVTGNYTIQAVGGNGAQFRTGTGQNGNCRGIDISTTTTLNKGEVIKILVGQQGGLDTNWNLSGGGGGTFVVRDIKTPIIVAGGGGGNCGGTGSHGGSLSGPYSDASSSTNGNGGIASLSGSTVTLLTNGGSDGGGGVNGYENSGGGGLISDGIKSAASITAGLAFINGGLGGNSEILSIGGFGGGGSARGGFGGGGGGGFSGGGGANYIPSPYAAAGGGGSYAINTMTVNGYNSSGQGRVIISLLDKVVL